MKKMVVLLMMLFSLFPAVSFAGEAITDSKEHDISLDTTQNIEMASSAIKNTRQTSYPNTGEKKTIYLSIAGIAVILLILLLLFIRSKK